MELILEYLGRAMDKKVSDVFIVSGMPVSFKIDGEVVPENEEKIMPERAAHISLRLKIRLSICIVTSRVSSASVSLRPLPTAMRPLCAAQ